MDLSFTLIDGFGEMKILGIFAHPDDETILIGGTLALLADRGSEVTILSATRGEGGELGEPPLTRRQSLGKVREQELRCAVRALGGKDVKFLGYEDPTIKEGQEGLAFDANFETLSEQIRMELMQSKPDVILTHGSNGEYGHPAHILVHQATAHAARHSQNSMYGISAHFNGHPRPRLANQDDPAHAVLDIRPWFDQKLSAAQCHRTQHALFVRRSSKEAGKDLGITDVLMQIESLHRFLPPDRDPSVDPLGCFLVSRCEDALLDIKN